MKLPTSKGEEQCRKLSRKQREEAVTRFIVALSDQKLATGLAVLIAVTANQCTIRAPDFQIAFSLAWFSATTHLATLDSLVDYFVRHKTLRTWRVIGMLVVMSFFLYCFIVILIIANTVDDNLLVLCCLQGDPWIDRWSLYEEDIPTYFAPWAITFLILLFGYKSKVLRAYEYGSGDFIGLGPFSRDILSIWSRLRYPRKSWLPRMSRAEWCEVQNEAARGLADARRRKLLQSIIAHRTNGHGRFAFATSFWRTWTFAEHCYRESLLSLLPLLTFMLAYSLSQVF
jgi:hypothetical protein